MNSIGFSKIYKNSVTLAFLILSLVLSSCSEKPDVIYTNGKIYTLDSKNTVVEAIAIKNGKILEVGTNKEISDKYKSDEVVDLKGATMLPGFIDSEGSIIEFSKNLNFINLSYARSVEEIKSLIIEKTKNTYSGEWIGCYGLNELNIPESELLEFDKRTLDQIAPGYSVYIVNVGLNTVWVNSTLMRELKIDRNTQSPPKGEIEKKADGELTGIFYDDAVNLIKDNIPGLLKKEMATQIEKGVKEIVKYGITEVQDRTIGKEGLEIIRELIDNNRFPLKIYAIISGEDSSYVNTYLKKGIEVGYKDKLTIRGISLDYDGLFELQDAYMTDEYINEPKKKVPYISDADFENIYSKSIDKNFQFFIKAVGDKAVSNSLKIIEKVIKKSNPKDQRTVIEYCEFVSQTDLGKIGELKLIPSVRPDICMNDIQILSQIIKPENSNKLGLWKSLIQSAGKINTGSDFPFHQINPFVQIYFLTTRQLTDTTLSNIPNPDQKISILDAVKSYTTWPAYTSFEENTKGSLEKGKHADMIIISNDIFKSDSKLLLETKVLRTIINGKVVYDNILDIEKIDG